MNPQISAIIAGLGFLEGHLCHPITVGDIADAAGYSLFHFIRTFNKIVRHTPYDYLMRRRLSHAAMLLFESDERVLDIALTCQFESHEGFTRAFGRLFGMTPTTWRENNFPDQRLLMPALTEGDLLFRQKPDFKPPELVSMQKMYLVGWMIYPEPDGIDGETNWQVFGKALLDNPINGRVDDAFWEVRDLLRYGQQDIKFIGVQVNELPANAVGYVIKVVEQGQYLCLSDIQNPEYRDAALKYIYHTFIAKSGLCLVSALELVKCCESNMLFVPVEVTE
jgi:AraC family transcriptional regulator